MKKVTRNKYYEKFAIFKEKLIEYLEQVRKGEEIEKLRKSITDKFEVLHSPLIPSNISA